MYEAIVKGEHVLEAGLPESFNVLLKELQALCLDVELIEDPTCRASRARTGGPGGCSAGREVAARWRCRDADRYEDFGDEAHHEGHLQLLREAEGPALVQRDPHLARLAGEDPRVVATAR